MKHWKTILPLLLLALLLSGCRVRTTTAALPEPLAQGPAVEAPPAPAARPETETAPQPESEPEPGPEPETAPADPDAPTEQDESAERREFAPDASGELTPGAEDALLAPTAAPAEQTAAPAENAGGEGTAVETEQGELTATETVPAEDAEQTGASETGEVADSVQTYYLTLLSDRVGELFECKRLYVYWETAEDHRTVFRTSREHELILGAGAYDVSARLLEENLTVDDGWVARKNPEAVVKIAPGGALDPAAAAALCAELAARPEWGGVNAVQSARVLVLSQSLLDTQAGRTAAMLYLAKLLYPDQLADVDADEALRALTEEADGAAWAGQYAYVM